jgi:ankyrin repeat protein
MDCPYATLAQPYVINGNCNVCMMLSKGNRPHHHCSEASCMSLAVHLMVVFLLGYGVNECFDGPRHHTPCASQSAVCMSDGLHSDVDG